MLVAEIAWTHVRARARQTTVALLGVAVGVGFSIMMAALMEGSQADFIRQLVDSLPHVTVSDERRSAPAQPAEAAFAAAEIHGLTPEVRRPGIKNPLATITALDAWIPGTTAPSVQTKAVIRYAGRDRNASVVGIDPNREARVSNIATKMRQGTLTSLYRATNAIIIGDRLAERLGARIGANVTLQGERGRLGAQVVGIFHTGMRSIDENAAYVLVKTAQILAAQTGLVNEIRVRLADPMAGLEVARRIETETGYKSVSWQEANEDLLNTFVIRNIIMYTVVGAILLVASFGTYNIISTITHEKARDIAIMKSLGFRAATVRRIFVLEALLIGLIGAMLGWILGYALCFGLGSVEIKSPFVDSNRLPLIYSPLHYAIAAAVALASSLVAGYVPARKAARLHPVEIIRGAT